VPLILPYRLIAICAVLSPFALNSPPANAQSPSAPSPQSATVFDHPFNDRLWLSGQINLISQFHDRFPSPYEGVNSFHAAPQHALSRVWTLYTGVRINRGLQVLADVESAGGHGLSDALGLAGFTNLDVVRNPSLGSTPYIARAMVVWTIPLTDDETEMTPTPLSLTSQLPVNRIDVRAGKLSMADFFDTNSVLSDSHLQFTNWTVDNNGAYDYAADTRGYTVAVVVEYVRSGWTLRGAEALMPTVANGLHLDGNVSRAHADNVELELRPTSRLTARILGYANHANMGSYDQAIDQFRSGLVAVPDIVAVRQQGRLKTGAGVNVEYSFARLVRLAFRTGWNEGHNESFAYTEVNNTIQGGGDITGELWRRRHDRVGVAMVTNGLSPAHSKYLQLGGLGFLLGDGALMYGRENIVEAYYTAYLKRGVSIAAGVEHVVNPGYNESRGPVSVGTVRVHVDF
jgi:high affinity Mn2+ porin